MRNEFVGHLAAHAETASDIVFITGDLGFSVVEPLQEMLGDRFLNAGVAEANMVSVAAGLALSGLHPFVYSIAPFVTMRCFEQIRNDLCYHKARAVLIGVGAGFSYGTLGPSHHALEDATILTSLPGMTVLSPGTVGELRDLFAFALAATGPVYFRLGRKSGPALDGQVDAGSCGAVRYRDGQDINIIASGTILEEAVHAADALARAGIQARVISIPVLSPFPHHRVSDLMADAPVLTVFEGYAGNPLEVGMMRVVLDRAMDGRAPGFTALNAGGAFATIVGDHDALLRAAGLDAASVAEAARTLIAG